MLFQPCLTKGIHPLHIGKHVIPASQSMEPLKGHLCAHEKHSPIFLLRTRKSVYFYFYKGPIRGSIPINVSEKKIFLE